MSKEQEPITAEPADEPVPVEAAVVETPPDEPPAKGRKSRKKAKRETSPSPTSEPLAAGEETPAVPETETPAPDEISIDDLLGENSDPSDSIAAEEVVEFTEPVEAVEPAEEGTRHALPQVVEAILFASQKPMSAKEILSVFKGAADAVKDVPDAPARAFAKIKEPQLREAIEVLEIACASPDRAYEVRESAVGWQLVTKPQYSPWLRQIFPEHRSARLSAPAMETLAIIAYRQPITRADIEAVRGVAVDGVMQTLLDRGLVKIAGRADVPGRPLLYDTTQNFMEHFGLKNLDDLPNAAELRKISLPTAEPPPAETPAEPAAAPAEPVAEPTPSDVSPAAEEPAQETPSENPAESSVETPISDLQSPISEEPSQSPLSTDPDNDSPAPAEQAIPSSISELPSPNP